MHSEPDLATRSNSCGKAMGSLWTFGPEGAFLTSRGLQHAQRRSFLHLPRIWTG